MARRHYLVAYDISDDKRRSRVFDALMDVGDHVQYSIFLCDLNPVERVSLRACLAGLIDGAEDQIIILDLGDAEESLPGSLECIGRRYVPPVRVQVV